MKQILSKLKYPKFLLLALTFVIAYVILSQVKHSHLDSLLASTGYAGVFISGILFAYGFTSGPATSLLMILSKSTNIIFAGVVGGLGALIADMIIFRFVRHSFSDEIDKMSKEKIVTDVSNQIPKRIRDYLLPAAAGVVIASPLPDEIGVSMMAASKKVSNNMFTVLSFLLNTAGIIIILYTGTLL